MIILEAIVHCWSVGIQFLFFLFLLDCAFICNLYPELKIYNLRQHSFLKPFVNPGNILAKFTTCTTRM